ncbi:uracil-DNA glycosylase family protein [Gordonia sp. FQ]|uniref:uracil-DNA glycosylase family protein n=1 Tax=Gordonia sp. FQ TaxID=3446634 RepID=UPI003F8482F8
MTIRNHYAHKRGSLLSRIHAPLNVQARMARRYDGQVGDLNRWVDELRDGTGESVPYLDPDAASDGVRILMLFQDPSGSADGESGFISRDNNDPTAHNYCEATEKAGVPYAYTLNWNVVPWWSTNNPAFPERTAGKEAPRAAPYLADFIGRLDEPPRVIVLSGKSAQHAWDRLSPRLDTDLLRGIEILRCPHPSPLSYNAVNRSDGRKNSEHIVETFRRAYESARNH